MLDVISDQNTPIYGHLARLSERLRGVPAPPIVRGVGPTPIPRPERLYVWFGRDRLRALHAKVVGRLAQARPAR
jgi:hypothetical protein